MNSFLDAFLVAGLFLFPALGVVSLVYSVKLETSRPALASALLLLGFAGVSYILLGFVGVIIGALSYVPVWLTLTITKGVLK